MRRTRTPRWLMHLVAITVAGLMLAAHVSVAGPTAVRRGGEITVLETDDFESLDPIYARGPDYLPTYAKTTA